MNPAVETVIPERGAARSEPQTLSGIGRDVSLVLERADEAAHVEVTSEGFRRALNLVVAGLLLVVFAPVMLLVAVLIKLSSPGPIIYRQPRVGVDRRDPLNTSWTGRRRIDYGGRLFMIYKFRTMRMTSSKKMQVWASQEEDRVTPLGRVLRLYRLDELPQLFNVLRGDMNIVGPRPEQPKIFMQLRQSVDGYSQRQRVLPGITGLAQINLRYDHSVDDVRRKVEFDLQYIQRRSAAQDLMILLQTVPVMVFRKGAV